MRYSILAGTGSTSWTYNVNKLTHQSVENILRIIFETTGQQINFKDPSVIEAVTRAAAVFSVYACGVVSTAASTGGSFTGVTTIVLVAKGL